MKRKKQQQDKPKKRPVGRPVERQMPDPIPRTLRTQATPTCIRPKGSRRTWSGWDSKKPWRTSDDLAN